MQFLSPMLLWGLAALAIPILLHLFYFRRFKKVEFSNVRFLKEVKEETQNRSRLRNLLVLLLRLLAFGALILAFAQPFFAGEDDVKEQESKVGIFVDNSYSMSAQASDVALLEKAKQRAREIIRTYGANTKYQLVTNDLGGKASRSLSLDDALAAVDDIKISAKSAAGKVIEQQFVRGASVDQLTEMPVYLISDFQESQFSEGALQMDTILAPKLVPTTAVVQRNISIDSVWSSTPIQLLGEQTELLVQLTNHGSEDADAVRVSALVNGSVQPFGTKSVPASSTVIDTIRLSAQRAGWTNAAISITDFPIEFDDTYRISFEARSNLRALAISAGQISTYLSSAFPAQGLLQLDAQRSANVNYSSLDNYDLIILDDLISLSSGLVQSLTAYTKQGGKVLVFPSAQADPSGYNRLLSNAQLPALGTYVEGSKNVGSVNTNSFVFRDVFERLPRSLKLPTTQGRYNYESGYGESLLTYRDGRPFVIGKRIGDGKIYLSTAPLAPKLNDLVRNGEIFVPMLYRMAFSGAAAKSLSYTIGEATVARFPLPQNTSEAALKLKGSGGEFIPAQRRIGSSILLSFGEVPEQAGFFELKTDQDSIIASIAVNDNRRESPQTFQSTSKLEASGLPIFDGNAAGSLEAALEREALGTQWWPILIGLGLLFLLLESLVLRFWQPHRLSKVTNVSGRPKTNNLQTTR